MAQADWRRYYVAVYSDGTCAEFLCNTRHWARSVAAFLQPNKPIVAMLGIKGKTAEVQRSLWSKVVYL